MKLIDVVLSKRRAWHKDRKTAWESIQGAVGVGADRTYQNEGGIDIVFVECDYAFHCAQWLLDQ